MNKRLEKEWVFGPYLPITETIYVDMMFLADEISEVLFREGLFGKPSGDPVGILSDGGWRTEKMIRRRKNRNV